MGSPDDKDQVLVFEVGTLKILSSSMRKPSIILLICLIFWSCKSEIPPTLILTNGKIWTGEGPETFVEALAINGNIITETGDSKSILALAGDDTQVIDLQGKLVTAGFNDAHIHFLGGSMGLTQVDLLATKSLEEVISITTEFISTNPEKEWITGRGWQYTYFESGLPDHETMKALHIDKPVFLKAYDGHSAYANPKALELAGITSSTVFEGFGEVVKDSNGNPTGALKEGAMDLVGKLVPEPSYQDKLQALRKGLDLAASLGITSMQNASGSEEELKLYLDLLSKNELTARYSASFSVGENSTPEQLDRFNFLKDSIGKENPWIRADAIKFMIDGVIESHTAAMLEHYADLLPSDELALGMINIPSEKFQSLVKDLDAKGFRLYTHAIGDRGVREVFSAYENAISTNPPRERRHRIEHIETISPDDIPRFSKSGILASMEPIHADPATVGVWSKAIGAERLPWSFAWKSILNSGAQLIFSSDWPACISLDPIRGIHVAVNRRDPSGFPEEGWIPQEKISVYEAMKAYTSMGAYSSFEESKKGLIKVGYLADLIVLSEDVFTVDPMKIHEIMVEKTILDGKIIFEKK
ncbi:amidohydrolase [Algoriphagus lacus]|uniref:Amidohydrolase n=2 Tax=Algoriphagus lacus TaxID=2056311 RepID=A0A418PUE9_9BACT|nr:amidohydrolase [Algoriphagus lacus]